MSNLLKLNLPMESIFWPKENKLIKQLLLIVFGAITLALAAQISIPLQPVPLTFQSATIILIGMAYGSRNGAYVACLYLLAGVMGLPVFANFSFGISTLMGPTAGYLLGFIPAAFLCGYLTEKGWGKNILLSFVTALLGASVIFICGVSVLSSFIGWEKAITFGLLPFIVSEAIKLFAVACFIPRCWKNSSGT